MWKSKPRINQGGERKKANRCWPFPVLHPPNDSANKEERSRVKRNVLGENLPELPRIVYGDSLYHNPYNSSDHIARLEAGRKRSRFLSTSSFYASSTMSFIIGRKIEMTQQFKEDGTVVPVTLIYAEPNTVTQVRSLETDGYVAVQVGSEEKSKLPKAQLGHIKDLPQVSTLKEFRVNSDVGLKRGDVITIETFQPGVHVDVTGISKGRGFAGVMKRYNFHGKNATHGTKDQERMPGSIASQRQGKVIK